MFLCFFKCIVLVFFHLFSPPRLQHYPAVTLRMCLSVPDIKDVSEWSGVNVSAKLI